MHYVTYIPIICTSCMQMMLCFCSFFSNMTTYKHCLLIIAVLIPYCKLTEGQTVNVTGKLGTVIGRSYTTTNGFQMDVYYGVPYAETPPQSRFSKPTPLTAFNPNPYPADSLKPACARWGPDGKTMDPFSSEDCLYLKILKPANTGGCCLPVAFWIQSGGFNDGGIIDFNNNNALGDNFVSKRFILVLVAHRQGPFGFFTTGTADAQGNWAVWDCLEALKFVRNNIRLFDGDPDRITIMGQESGAVMTELLFLSPLANGLYSSVILIDGTAFDPSIIKNDQVNLERSQLLANNLNCDNSTGNLWNTGQRSAVLTCLRNQTAADLTSAVGRNDMTQMDPGSILHNYFWRPRFDGVDGVFPDTFENLAARRQRVPVLLGVMRDDWLSELFMFTVNTTNSLPANFNTTYNTPSFVTNTCLNLVADNIYGAALTNSLKQACVERYNLNSVSNQNLSDPYFWLHKAGRVSTAFHLMAPFYKTTNFLRNQGNSQVYLYSFDYCRRSEGAYWEANGAFRYLDLDLIFNFGTVPFNFNADDTFVKDLFSETLSNFVIFKNPTPSNYTKARWTPFGSGNCYLSIDTKPKMWPNFYLNDAQFWINNGALN